MPQDVERPIDANQPERGTRRVSRFELVSRGLGGLFGGLTSAFSQPEQSDRNTEQQNQREFERANRPRSADNTMLYIIGGGLIGGIVLFAIINK